MPIDESDPDENLPSWHTGIAVVAPAAIDDLDHLTRDDKVKRLLAAALRQKSPATIRSYEAGIADFSKYMEISTPEEGLRYLLSLDRLDAELRVLEYMGWMENRNLAPSTIRLRLSALKFYVKTAYRAQWINWTLESQGPPQENVKEVEGPTPSQFKRILLATDSLKGKAASRNRTLIYMLSFMGLRISECLSLDMEHVDLGRGAIMVKRKGKRMKRVPLTVPKKTLELMKQWVRDRGGHPGPFFSNLDLREDKAGYRLNRSTAWKIVRKLGEKSGVEGLHPHAFRHFSATEALELTDGNTRDVMKHTGHSSERMVTVYEDKREDVPGRIAQQIEDRWKNPADAGEEE